MKRFTFETGVGELELNEIIKVNGVRVQCVENPWNSFCSGKLWIAGEPTEKCFLNRTESGSCDNTVCRKYYRKDNLDVIFVELKETKENQEKEEEKYLKVIKEEIL